MAPVLAIWMDAKKFGVKRAVEVCGAMVEAAVTLSGQCVTITIAF